MMPEDRLRQAEALLETAARYITRHEEAIARHEEAIARQAEVNTRLDLRMLELVDMFSELTTITRRNQEEIRRIWEYLMSQSGNGRQSDEG